MSGPSKGCIDAELAARYADHQLAEGVTAEVEAHIDVCETCRELISALAKSQWSTSAESSDPDAPATLAGVLPRGTMIGPFEIERPLDAGGMGLVYIARDPRLDRAIAIKAVRDGRAPSDKLLHEARAMAQLSHPNIVAVHDVIEAHGQIFLAMELVVGRSVRQWLDVEKPDWRAIVAVFLAAGEGLAATHAAGIVHGDVKPANMLYGDDGRVRLSDFGLASGADPDDGQPRGTPAYMAPAQRRGVPCDAAGDQYAFCAGLHEALFGALPGSAAPRASRVPRSVRRVLARGLANDPGQRYASMEVLLRALRRAAARRWRLLAAAAVAVAAIGVVAYATGGRRIAARMCEASSANLASPWGELQRFQLRASFATTRLSYASQIRERVEDNLDRWTAEFDRVRTEACEPGWFATEPAPQLAGELACLEDRARDVRALTNVFSDAVDAATVLRAVPATEQLDSPATCAAPPRSPAPSAVAPALAQLADRSARVFALLNAGRPREALPLARELVTAADATEDLRARGAARVSLGRTLVAVSEYEPGRTALLEGIRFAELARDDRLRVQAWVNLVMLQYQQGHYEEALTLEKLAIGAAESLGDVYLETELMIVAATSLAQLGKPAEALPMFEHAVELRRGAYGDRSSRTAEVLTALGNAYAMKGDLDAGTRAHALAIEIAEATLGASHPDVGTMHGNLGDDYLYGLRAEPARAELAKAVKILAAAQGPDSRQVAGTTTDLGLALLELGQPEAALDAFERAEVTWTKVAPNHPGHAESMLGRNLAREALGRPIDLSELEAALVIGAQLPPFERARIQFALARAGSADRAGPMITQALAGFATTNLPLIARELERARAWQRAHGAPK